MAGVVTVKRTQISETGLKRLKFHEFDDTATRLKPADIELTDDV